MCKSRQRVLDMDRPGMGPGLSTNWLCDLVQVGFLIYKMRKIIFAS